MNNSSKKTLLFVTAFLPGPVGGSNLRVLNTLAALSPCHQIHLLFVSPWRGSQPAPDKVPVFCSELIDFPEKKPGRIATLISRLFRLIHVALNVPPSSYAQLPIAEDTKGRVALVTASIRYDAIHFFKLETSCLLEPIRNRQPDATIHLDLDDIESLRWQRTREIQQINGDYFGARRSALRGAACQELERTLLPGLDRVYVCSELDQQRLEDAYHLTNVLCLPNVYPLRAPRRQKTHDGSAPFCYIFVGSWGYYPNQDGLLFFCREILPLLRERHRVPFIVRIIGQGKLRRTTLRMLEKHKEICFVGRVDELAGYYRKADVAIIPLRAGGGTRLKILEAFAYGLPVVSTSIGAEGLDLMHDTHALIADSPVDFAAQCARLTNEPDLGVRLSENAQALLNTKYSPERLKEILCGQAIAPPTAN